MKIVLLGPGLMGSQIACEYALGGHEVVVLARRPEVASERIERGFSTAREHGLATPEQVAAARQRMTIAKDIDITAGAQIIVESVVEDLVEKKEALLPVVARNPDAIVASNTSSIPITAIGAAVGAGERTVGAHYWNPPLLMPMVELIRGDETAEDIVPEMTTTLRALGKRPVLVDRDVQGFAWNRL
ncbi:MAG: 3-hydroxyacyl-CoA dehydrogenase family protein, partial [Thermomicrobiales bacterium]|nr:3-hydroxyacyl-CoA dehydrogenase family protein [Thermomicrobiales bacterium]